jgi:hypothetical protein
MKNIIIVVFVMLLSLFISPSYGGDRVEKAIRREYYIKAIQQKYEYKHREREIYLQGKNQELRIRYQQRLWRRQQSRYNRTGYYNPVSCGYYSPYSYYR